LFKVPPLLFVNQYQVEVVADTELLVDVTHGGREVIASQEQANGNGLACREWSPDREYSNMETRIWRCGEVEICLKSGMESGHRHLTTPPK